MMSNKLSPSEGNLNVGLDIWTCCGQLYRKTKRGFAETHSAESGGAQPGPLGRKKVGKPGFLGRNQPCRLLQKFKLKT